MLFLPDDVDKDFGVCSDAAGDDDHDSGDLSDHDGNGNDGDNDGDDDGDGNGDHHDGSDDNEALDGGVLQRKSLSCYVHHVHEELYSSQLLRLW